MIEKKFYFTSFSADEEYKEILRFLKEHIQHDEVFIDDSYSFEKLFEKLTTSSLEDIYIFPIGKPDNSNFSIIESNLKKFETFHVYVFPIFFIEKDKFKTFKENVPVIVLGYEFEKGLKLDRQGIKLLLEYFIDSLPYFWREEGFKKFKKGSFTIGMTGLMPKFDDFYSMLNAAWENMKGREFRFQKNVTIDINKIIRISLQRKMNLEKILEEKISSLENVPKPRFNFLNSYKEFIEIKDSNIENEIKEKLGQLRDEIGKRVKEIVNVLREEETEFLLSETDRLKEHSLEEIEVCLKEANSQINDIFQQIENTGFDRCYEEMLNRFKNLCIYKREALKQKYELYKKWGLNNWKIYGAGGIIFALFFLPILKFLFGSFLLGLLFSILLTSLLVLGIKEYVKKALYDEFIHEWEETKGAIDKIPEELLKNIHLCFVEDIVKELEIKNLEKFQFDLKKFEEKIMNLKNFLLQTQKISDLKYVPVFMKEVENIELSMDNETKYKLKEDFQKFVRDTVYGASQPFTQEAFSDRVFMYIKRQILPHCNIKFKNLKIEHIKRLIEDLENFIFFEGENKLVYLFKPSSDNFPVSSFSPGVIYRYFDWHRKDAIILLCIMGIQEKM